ncbi:MAG: DUF3488 domain-containing transglutaminase family protein [Desulfamplus sp.]|nr:DUF3488 domain-containing transglutaminase family protein [Desulfamplus sp.]
MIYKNNNGMSFFIFINNNSRKKILKRLRIVQFYADKQIKLIIFSLLVAIAPHLFNLPLWVILWIAIMWSYIFIASAKEISLPNKKFYNLLAILGVIGVFSTYRIRFGGEGFVALMSIMAGLKPFEIRTYRDRIVTIFLAYFIVITCLFISENFAITVYMFASVFFSTAVLISINFPNSNMKENFKFSGIIIAQAIPLMIILFLAFPRIQGSLWGMSRQQIGKTGFSENITLGSISELVQSNEIAFRVKFKDKIPPPPSLYWRGIVYESFGRKSLRINRNLVPRKIPISGTNEVDYSVSLEPHDKKWLFALELPLSTSFGSQIMEDHTLKTRRSVHQKIRYKVTSYLDYKTSFNENHIKSALTLPKFGNLKSRELGKTFNEIANGNAEKIVELALNYFKENDFVYTLKPGVLSENALDDFLFKTKKGFCEHYAAAFVFLIRAAGVPANVIGGYQGGEINPYGDYIIVRQSDAHAWSEVFITNKGWIRIDPTFIVAPQRIERGFENSLSSDEMTAFIYFKKFGLVGGLLEKIRLGWDAINSQWDLIVMSYSYLEQRAFLSRFGIHFRNWKDYAIIIFSIIGIISFLSIIIFILVLKKSLKKQDAVLKVYKKFCLKAEKIGLSRGLAQGPIDYADMIIKKMPELKDIVSEITEIYVSLRYAGESNPQTLKKLKQIVNKF